ncbi:GNAT family N-acetyltransferase [Nocardia brasiliensis]|uniref:GNAT family N-acetyltransferase n=1 Tax=Nocardia brasiliensis TaxID=37326 RepID=UPI002458916D|nr:GNAT family N-acetyltransferase [Nocardia brasiliensis]
MSRDAVHGNLTEITLIACDFDGPDSARILLDYAQERRSIVGFDDPPGLDNAIEYRSPHGRFVLAYTAAGDTVACGGVRTYPHREHVMEIRKMYVRPDYRILGLGRRILAELEQYAVIHGAHEVLLETGSYNHAAIHLYTAAGYRLIPAYVPGRPDFNRAFTKRLAP